MKLHKLLYLTPTLFLVACAGKNGDSNTVDPMQGHAAGEGDSDGGEGGPNYSSKTTGSSGRGAGAVPARRAKLSAEKPPRPKRANLGSGGGDSSPNGLVASVFDVDASATAVPDLSAGTPTSTFEVDNIDVPPTRGDAFPGSEASGAYAIRFAGSLNVAEEGEFELCLESDDGSKMFLMDTVVVDNDGVFDVPQKTCELVFLEAGEYELAVDYVQVGGEGLMFQMSWGMDGAEPEAVPTEVLFKPGT